MTDEMIKLGTYNQELNKIIGTEMKSLDIYRSKGLPAHLLKRKHFVFPQRFSLIRVKFLIKRLLFCAPWKR